MHALMKEVIIDSTALICARSGMLKMMANVRSINTQLKLDHGKPADLVGRQPLIVSSKSLSLSSLLQAKSNRPHLHDRIQSLRSQLTKATMALVTHLHHQIRLLQVSPRARFDHLQRHSRHRQLARINRDTKLLQTAAITLHLTP